jgi:hypothetical protein
MESLGFGLGSLYFVLCTLPFTKNKEQSTKYKGQSTNEKVRHGFLPVAPAPPPLLEHLFVGGGPLEPNAAVCRHRFNRGPA